MLYFHNPGEIDIRGATIAGLSAKLGNNPIGFFGTGLKYAIANVLRMNGSITIWSGEQGYKFWTKTFEFRGNNFSSIYMKTLGQLGSTPLGFTTEYGKTWEPWQIFRELYANALDEGGGVSNQPVEPARGKTVIEISCTELDKIYPARNEIILPEEFSYFHETADVKISRNPSNYIYYRGVRVYEAETLFTYNFLQDMQLTEDRTLRWAFTLPEKIGECIKMLDDEDAVLRAVSAPKNLFEARAEYPTGASSLAFLSCAERLFKQDPRKWAKFRDILAQHRPAVLQPTLVELSRVQQAMLQRAIALADRINMRPSDFPIFVAELGNSTLGKYEPATGSIYLSPRVFEMGTKQVLSTLYEELVHAQTGMSDCTYDMQTYLFDKIITLYEEFLFREPI